MGDGRWAMGDGRWAVRALPSMRSILERLDDEVRNHPGAQVAALQTRRERSKALHDSSTAPLPAPAAQRPDVIVAGEGGVVEDDLCARANRLDREEVQRASLFAHGGIRRARVVHIPAHVAAGIEIRLGAEA